MDRQTNEKRARKPYRIVGKTIWALVRARYLAGQSARKVAGDLGVTESAIRARIWREGWSKQALAEAQAGDVIAQVEALDAADAALWADADGGAEGLTPTETARRALAMAAALMRQGRMLEAAAAARVAEAMGRAAMRLEGDGGARAAEDDEAVLEAVRRKVMGWAAGAGALPPPPLRGPPPPMGEEFDGAAFPLSIGDGEETA